MGKIYDLIVIGGGSAMPAALAGLLHENAEQGGPLDGLRIAVVEPRDRLGVGAAWDLDQQVLSNMPAANLRIHGAVTPDGASIETKRKVDLIGADGQSPLLRYISRARFGDRLHERFDELRTFVARASMTLDHVRSMAIRIEREGTRWRVVLASGETLKARCVVLALGLLSIDRFPDLGRNSAYYADPWSPVASFDRLGYDARIGIAGLGPSAVDWVLQLAAVDRRHAIVMASPSGRLPAVRPVSDIADRPGIYDGTMIRELAGENPFGSREVDLIIFGLLERFGVDRADLREYCGLFRGTPRGMLERTLALSGEPQPLFEALKLVDDLAPTIWRWSGMEGKSRIMTRWAKVHAALSYSIPPSNARELLSHLNNGRVQVRSGLTGAACVGGRIRLTFKKGKDAGPFDALINATGFEGPLRQANNLLVRSLLAAGLIVEGEFGGAVLDYETGEVRKASGRRVAGLYIAGGSLTRTAGYFVNSLLRTSEHGVAVGFSCARYLQRLGSLSDIDGSMERKADLIVRLPAHNSPEPSGGPSRGP